LIGIFSRLGLPLLALAKADPTRLGDAAGNWGTYYDTQPIVVAGRLQMALERTGQRASPKGISSPISAKGVGA
jgi:hypothetical protein